MTNFLLKEQVKGHLQGFWVFEAPFLIKFMFQVGLRLHKTVIPVVVAKDYREAVRSALKVLRQGGVDVGSRLYSRLKKDEWALDIEEYGYSTIGWINIGEPKDTYRKAYIALNKRKRGKVKLVKILPVKNIIPIMFSPTLRTYPFSLIQRKILVFITTV